MPQGPPTSRPAATEPRQASPNALVAFLLIFAVMPALVTGNPVGQQSGDRARIVSWAGMRIEAVESDVAEVLPRWDRRAEASTAGASRPGAEVPAVRAARAADRAWWSFALSGHGPPARA